MIKGSIQEEDITIVNIYAPNIEAPQYIRQILTAIKGEIDSNTIIVVDFITHLSPVDRSSKMKINKKAQALNDTLNKMDLIDIYMIGASGSCASCPRFSKCGLASELPGTLVTQFPSPAIVPGAPS